MTARSPADRQAVFDRARHRCEYCQTPRRVIGMPLVIDHIVPRSQGGEESAANWCAACYRCNEFKATRTHALDPATGALVPLFHPREQSWQDHFAWANGGTHIVGLSPTGRATVIALRLNNEYLVEARVLWIAWQWHPPED
jgi:5-methylcytosine-specific restriction endonuclease McrA